MSAANQTVILPAPDKAKTDLKEYRSIRLPNGLRALLISDTRYPLERLDEEERVVAAVDNESEDDESDSEDSESDEDAEEVDQDMMDVSDGPPKRSASATGLKKSAAALCVGVGSFSDPKELPGLAHFLEHMLFMGSKKYPDENDFDHFVNKNGGFDNAFTDCETTVFYFECQRRSFREALDKFAHFFISPLMKKSAMAREREAVDSEFEMALTSDSSRKEQIFGSLAKEGHPMTKFMWGNLKSLKQSNDGKVYKMLHAFKERHYSSEVMTLAIQAQEELDTMQKWVEESFGSVPKSKEPQETFHHLLEPFETDKFHKLYKIVPVKNTYQLDLHWALPPLMDKYREKPLHYLSWIIGHEGKGSLTSFLRKKVWALNLTAGNEGTGFEFNSTFSIFAITITLTESGFQNVDKVTEAVFGYLSMLRSEPANERIFNEIKRIEDLDFEYGPEEQPTDNVETLCSNMQWYPPEKYLTGDELLFDFDADLIAKCVNALNPEGVNVFLMSKSFASECAMAEPWFGTKYKMEDIPSDWMESWKRVTPDQTMFLPEPNKFIADDLTLKMGPKDPNAAPKPPTFPISILTEPQGELFFKMDDTFYIPWAYYNFYLVSPSVLKSARSAVAVDLLVSCVCQLMVEDTYPADLAQLSFSLFSTDRGIVIKCSGLNQKLQELLEVMLDHLRNFEHNVTDDLFLAVKQEGKKNLYNHFIKPMKLAKEVRLSVLQSTFRTSVEKHAILESMTLKEVIDFAKELVAEVYLQGLVQGNVTDQEAKEAYDLVKTKLGLDVIKDKVVPEMRCNQVPQGHRHLRCKGLNEADGNTVVTNYYQLGPGDLFTACQLDMLITLMEEPVFDTLRTKEQLGYVVYAMFHNTFGVLGYNITVCAQASKHDPDFVDSRIEHFLTWFLTDKLASMTHDEFQEHLQTLIKQKRAADVKMSEEVSRNWSEVVSREYLFDRYVKEAEILESGVVTKKSVSKLLESMIQKGQLFKKLSIQVVGNPEGGTAKDEDTDETTSDTTMAKVFEIKLDRAGDNFVSDPSEFKASLTTHDVIKIIK